MSRFDELEAGVTVERADGVIVLRVEAWRTARVLLI
jgi:hypothetical protein